MRQYDKIFRSNGKTVIVAMDHGLNLDVLPALNDTGGVIEKIIAGGADAILTSYGIARKYNNLLKKIGLIIRMDGGNSRLSGFPGCRLLYSVEDAVKLGADGIACMGFPGAVNEEETLMNIAALAAACDKAGIPLIAEMLPGGFKDEPPNTVENIRLVSRIGAELGAHIIKTAFTGTGEEFKQVVDGCFVPLVVLGGSHTKNIEGLFNAIHQALSAGAAGVAIGRNVWQSKHPDKVVSALVQLVHQNKSVEEALKVVT